MDVAEAIAQRIKRLCNIQGITINKLASLSGLTQSTVDSILKGKSKNPRISTIKKICKGLEITCKDFFDDEIFNQVE